MSGRASLIPWRERAFVSLGETASIFGRSVTWVRNQVTDGRLVCARLPTGAVGITVRSVLALVDATEPVFDEPASTLRPPRARPYLAVNNDR